MSAPSGPGSDAEPAPPSTAGGKPDAAEGRPVAPGAPGREDLSLLSSLPVGVFRTTLDDEGEFLEANQALARMLGYESVEALKAAPVVSIYPDPLDRRRTIRACRDAGGAMTHTRLELRTRDRKPLWVSVNARLVPDEEGRERWIDGIMVDVAEHRRAEEALRESEERYRTVYNTAPLAFVTWDRECRITDWNDYARDIFGWTRDEVIGRSFFEFLIPEGARPRVKDVVERLLEGEIERHIVHENLTRSGKVITCEWNNSVFRDPRGEIVGAMSLGLDVSARVIAESALRESEKRFRSLLRNLQIGVYRTSGGPEGRFIEANPAMAEILGYDSVAELMTVPMCSLCPDAGDALEGVSGSTRRGGISRRREVQLRRKDGRVIWAEVTSRAERDGDGNTLHVDGVIEDITERKWAREALLESEEKYRLVFKNVHMGVSVHEVLPGDGRRLVDCNDRYVQASGFSREKLLRAGDTRRLQESRLTQSEEDRIRERAENGLPVRGEFSWKRPDGEFNRVEYTTAYYEARGRRYAVAVDHDITDRRQAEEEKRQLEEQLRQAEKMRAVGELAGGVAHDFNNQLAAIMGCAEMLGRKLQNDPVARYADMIVKASRRASDLTGQLLAFARKGKYRAVAVDLHAVIEEVLGLLEHSIDKRISLSREFTPERAVVTGDPAQLENALLNIALNARDAMPGGGSLAFSTDLVDLDREYCRSLPYEMESGRYVLVRVSDTGTGMSEEVREHIFEPFFTTKAVGKGTGMGLAAVYGTIKSHGGAVEVSSEPGEGTVFRIYLPVADREEQAPGEAGAVAPEAAGASCVLVVDDEELVRDVACRALGSLGYRTLACADGAEALELYRRDWRKIDLVLLDMVMPRMNGPATFAAMRGINPEARVVVSSGYSLDGEAGELLERGAAGFIQKPYRIADLGRAVAGALEK